MLPVQNLQIPTAPAQPSLTPKRLDRSGRTTSIHGASALIYGLPFVIAGLSAALFAAKMHPSGNATAVNDLRFSFLVLFASMCFLGGLFFSAHGVRDLFGDARKRRFSAEQPAKPWLGDYAWRAGGFKFSALRETNKVLLTAMIGTMVVGPFVWVALGNPFAWAFDIFVGMLAVLPCFAWYRWLVMVVMTIRFGTSFLAYDTFPYLVGGALEARLRLRRNQSSIQSLTVTLRCVQEKYVTTGGGRRWGSRRGVTSTESYELSMQILVLDQAQMATLNGDGIPLQFSIPPDAPTTQLSSHPPTYWEIEATGETQGPPYHAVFLVPVYSVSRP